MAPIATRRLGPGDRDAARTLFAMMAAVFAEECEPLGDGYLDRLLGRHDFWAVAAVVDGAIVGGLTAHVMPMTRTESAELFVYDVAVREDHQRQGVGRQLIAHLRRAAADDGIGTVFVGADDDDADAIEFYRRLGGEPSAVTFFTFDGDAP